MKDTAADYYRRLSRDRRSDVLVACNILLADVTASDEEIIALLQVRALLAAIEPECDVDSPHFANATRRP